MYISNKIALIVYLTFVVSSSLTNSKHWSKDTREFLTSFFGVIKGKSWSLDIDCLDGQYNEYAEDLEFAVVTKNFYKVIEDLEKIIKLESQKCPLKDIYNIETDFNRALRNGTLLKNMMIKFSLVKTTMKEYDNSDKSYFELGKCIGHLAKIAIYGSYTTSWEDPHEIGSLQFLK